MLYYATEGDLYMPTTNKRINLTIPDNVYERLLTYKQKNGITSDSSACLQLIVRQLDSIDQGELMMQMVSRFSVDELKQISNVGFDIIKAELDKKEKNLI